MGSPRSSVPLTRNRVDTERLNSELHFPFELRPEDFQMAMQDVYDFFYDVNAHLLGKGLHRLDDMLRPAIMSGVLSDVLTGKSKVGRIGASARVGLSRNLL